MPPRAGASRAAPHVSRITYHVSRITYHVSRITYHVSRITYHVSRIRPEELEQQLVHPLRRIGHDPVAGVGDVGDADVGDPALESVRVRQVEVAVAVAPDDQRGLLDAG